MRKINKVCIVSLLTVLTVAVFGISAYPKVVIDNVVQMEKASEIYSSGGCGCKASSGCPPIAEENLPIPSYLEEFIIRGWGGGGPTEFIKGENCPSDAMRDTVHCGTWGSVCSRHYSCPCIYPVYCENEQPRHLTDTDGNIWIPIWGTWREKWADGITYFDHNFNRIGGPAPRYPHYWTKVDYCIVEPVTIEIVDTSLSPADYVPLFNPIPKVRIDSPSDGKVNARFSKIAIGGNVEDLTEDLSGKVLVDGKEHPINIAGDGSFSASVELVKGTNIVAVVVQNKIGNKGVDSFKADVALSESGERIIGSLEQVIERLEGRLSHTTNPWLRRLLEEQIKRLEEWIKRIEKMFLEATVTGYEGSMGLTEISDQCKFRVRVPLSGEEETIEAELSGIEGKITLTKPEGEDYYLSDEFIAMSDGASDTISGIEVAKVGAGIEKLEATYEGTSDTADVIGVGITEPGEMSQFISGEDVSFEGGVVPELEDVAWSWNIAGPETKMSSDAEPVLTFTTPGIYTAILKATAEGVETVNGGRLFEVAAPRVEITSISPNPLIAGYTEASIEYKISPESFNGTYGSVRIYSWDENDPVYMDDSIPIAGGTHTIKWNGIWNQGQNDGKYANANNSPYKVKITIGIPEFETFCEREDIGVEAWAFAGRASRWTFSRDIRNIGNNMSQMGYRPVDRTGSLQSTASLKQASNNRRVLYFYSHGGISLIGDFVSIKTSDGDFYPEDVPAGLNYALVFFNGCKTATTGPDNVGDDFMDKYHAKAYVGWDRNIAARWARDVGIRFFRELKAGKPVNKAIENAAEGGTHPVNLGDDMVVTLP